MFGLFKKAITPTEFGQGLIQLSSEWIAADAGRSLGVRFPNFSASEGWTVFLERQGIAVPVQKLHFRLYTHCAVQAISTQFEHEIAWGITGGAMNAFNSDIEGYDFSTTYGALDAAYRGQYRFSPTVAPLSNPTAQLAFLRNPNVGVVNAKYLLDNFLMAHMPNFPAYVDGFGSYSTTVTATVGGTLNRAVTHLSRSFKLR